RSDDEMYSSSTPPGVSPITGIETTPLEPDPPSREALRRGLAEALCCGGPAFCAKRSGGVSPKHFAEADPVQTGGGRAACHSFPRRFPIPPKSTSMVRPACACRCAG